MPDSKMPRRKRTAHKAEKLVTKAVQVVRMPKPSVVAGMNHPGPTYLQSKLEGISKMM